MARPSHPLVWATPKNPVIVAGTVNQYHRLRYDTPAKENVIILAVDEAARAAGLSQRIRPHDFRRGAAFEIATLPVANVRGEAGAAQLLGHSKASVAADVTSRYVGHTADDTWYIRVRTVVKKRTKYILEFAPAPVPFKRRRNSPKDVTAFCESKGLDPTDPKSRHKASVQLRKQKNVPSNEEKIVIPQVQPLDEPSALEPARYSSLDTTEDSAMYPAPYSSLDTTEDSVIDSALFNSPGTTEDPALHTARYTTRSVTQSATGVTSLRVISAEKSPTLVGSSSARDAPAAILDPQSGSSDDPAAVLHGDPYDFATYLATVNMYRFDSPESIALPAWVKSGGSRDPPTRWMYPCPLPLCPRTFANSKAVNGHAKNCNFGKSTEGKMVCEKCGYAVGSRAAFSKHRVHCYYVPAVCTKDFCSDQTLWPNPHALQGHIDRAHHGWTRYGCPVEGCPRLTEEFINKGAQRSHMFSLHHDVYEQLMAWVDGAEYPPLPDQDLSWTRRNCPVAYCKWNNADFISIRYQTVHFQKFHEHHLVELKAWVGGAQYPPIPPAVPTLPALPD